jgi:predicted RNA binding protein YcfA (HicA-like mRNA interferase family)
MKRRELIGKIEAQGAVFIRHGGKHDFYQNPQTKISQPVPRHREIKEHLARHILKMLSRQP